MIREALSGKKTFEQMREEEESEPCPIWGKSISGRVKVPK